MSTHPELSGIAPQMAEHYLKIPTPLQRSVLDWLTTHVTELPTRERMQMMQEALKPIGWVDTSSRPYQHVAMGFVRSRSPTFKESNIGDPSATAEVYRACLGMINGLSQEDVLEGLIGIEGFKRQLKVAPQ